MTCIIPNLKEYGIPTKSVGEAVRYATTTYAHLYNNKHKVGFEDMIEKLLGKPVVTKHAKEAEMLFGYIVQVAVSMHTAGFVTTAEQVHMEAEQKVVAYFVKNPWVMTTPTISDIVIKDGVEVATTSAGPKKRVGPSKKDQCIALFAKDGNKDKTRKELIEIFVKELDLTPAGASTYVHNCQKAIWK